MPRNSWTTLSACVLLAVANCSPTRSDSLPVAPQAAGCAGAAATGGLADSLTGHSVGGDTTAGGNAGRPTAVGGSASNDPTSGTLSIPLIPSADLGWVSRDSNVFGVQGPWYTLGYEETENLAPPEGSAFENAGDGTLCVSGTAPQLIDSDPSKYEGAAMGFDLCASGRDEDPPETRYTASTCPNNPDLAAWLVGISFTLTGELVPGELRVVFREANRDQSAYVLANPGLNTALLADSSVAEDATAPSADPNNVEGIHFHVAASPDHVTPFAFCVSQVMLLVSEGGQIPTVSPAASETGGS